MPQRIIGPQGTDLTPRERRSMLTTEATIAINGERFEAEATVSYTVTNAFCPTDRGMYQWQEVEDIKVIDVTSYHLLGRQRYHVCTLEHAEDVQDAIADVQEFIDCDSEAAQRAILEQIWRGAI